MKTHAFPKISIVVHCFNREDYIAHTIENILAQEYPNLDLVVIDDDSTDRSWEIIQRYKEHLGYCEHIDTHSKSAQVGLEYGFSKTTGDIMVEVSAKAMLLPGALKTVGRVFAENPDIEWLTSINCMINADDSIISVAPVRKDLHEHLLRMPWNLQTESTFWRRSLWERAGAKWDHGLGWAADFGLWCHFFAVGAKLYHLNSVLGAYRKTKSANGVTNPGQYYESAERYRAWLKHNIAKKELAYAYLYALLRYFKPILRNIPDRIYALIPILNHFCNEAIAFKDMDTLRRFKRNPFRTVYPW